MERNVTVLVCSRFDMHPYNCQPYDESAPTDCPHCLKVRAPDHDPDRCALCLDRDEDPDAAPSQPRSPEGV